MPVATNRKSQEFVLKGMCIWHKPLQAAGPEQVVERCQEAGVEAIFPFSSSGMCGDEYYAETLPRLVELAHAAQVEVLFWMDELRPQCYREGETLLQVLKDGKPGREICPANPVVREHNVAEAARLISEYGGDGILLEDSLQFSHNSISNFGCFCDYCKSAAPAAEPEWRDWRRARLAQLVAELREAVHKVKPDAPISLGCNLPYDINFYKGHEDECSYIREWEGLYDARNFLGMNWADWLKEGLLDYACPMNYALEDQMGCFRIKTKEMVKLMSETACPFYVCLGFRFSTGRNGPDTVRRQMDICREAGLSGMVIYDWDGMTEEHWKMLRKEMGT